MIKYLKNLLKKIFGFSEKKIKPKVKRKLIKINESLTLQESKEVIEIKEPSNYEKALDYIINNKDKIVIEKEENKLKILSSANSKLKFIRFKKILFCFDNEGFDLFQREFNQKPYELDIKKGIYKNGKEAFYLIRINKKNYRVDFFHRWFMQDEIDDFCLENDYERKEVVVHHRDFNSTINYKDNLQVMTIEEHNEIHNR